MGISIQLNINIMSDGKMSCSCLSAVLSLGARIIMACRDMEKADAALKEVKDASGNQDVVISKLDLADSKSIREFAEKINEGEITGYARSSFTDVFLI